MKGAEATRRQGKVSRPAIVAEDKVKEKGEGKSVVQAVELE